LQAIGVILTFFLPSCEDSDVDGEVEDVKRYKLVRLEPVAITDHSSLTRNTYRHAARPSA